MASDRTDLPDLTGTTYVVTGANSGIGLEAARKLVDAGGHVVLAVRDPARGEAAAATLTALGRGPRRRRRATVVGALRGADGHLVPLVRRPRAGVLAHGPRSRLSVPARTMVRARRDGP